MAESKIEWTDRSDWNPIRGCTRVSPGCGGPGPHGGCYAEGIAARFSGPGQPFDGFARMVAGKPRWTGKVELMPDRLLAPLSWRKPAKVFACSMSDLFHEDLPDSAIDQVFAVMALCPHLTFQVLTKRAARMREYFSGIPDCPGEPAARDALIEGSAQLLHHQRTGEDPSMWLAVHMPLPNVWIGVSVERQQEADQRIPDLLATPAAVRFISAEPLLGQLDISHWLRPRQMPNGGGGDHAPGWTTDFNRLNWVIAGGESGRSARPAHPDWFRSLRDQCADAGVAFFFKQHGEWLPGEVYSVGDKGGFARHMDGTDGVHSGKPDHWWSGDCWSGVISTRVGKKAAGALLDGREWREFPA